MPRKTTSTKRAAAGRKGGRATAAKRTTAKRGARATKGRKTSPRRKATRSSAT